MTRGENKATTTADAARLTSLTECAKSSLWRARELLNHRRGTRNRYEYSFQDIVVLRRIKGMLDQDMPLSKIIKGISALQVLSPRKPLSAVIVQSLGSEVVVRDRQTIWNPETGQTLLNFDSEIRDDKENIREFPVREAELRSLLRELDQNLSKENLTSHDWFNIGMELESVKEPKPRGPSVSRSHPPGRHEYQCISQLG